LGRGWDARDTGLTDVASLEFSFVGTCLSEFVFSWQASLGDVSFETFGCRSNDEKNQTKCCMMS
jgi:hypothetical protein